MGVDWELFIIIGENKFWGDLRFFWGGSGRWMYQELANKCGLTFIIFLLGRYENEDGDLYLRKANESIEIIGSELSFNKGEAFHMYTPFREIYSSNISEITVMINETVIADNGRVIFQYSK